MFDCFKTYPNSSNILGTNCRPLQPEQMVLIGIFFHFLSNTNETDNDQDLTQAIHEITSFICHL